MARYSSQQQFSDDYADERYSGGNDYNYDDTRESAGYGRRTRSEYGRGDEDPSYRGYGSSRRYGRSNEGYGSRDDRNAGSYGAQDRDYNDSTTERWDTRFTEGRHRDDDRFYDAGSEGSARRSSRAYGGSRLYGEYDAANDDYDEDMRYGRSGVMGRSRRYGGGDYNEQTYGGDYGNNVGRYGSQGHYSREYRDYNDRSSRDYPQGRSGYFSDNDDGDESERFNTF